MGPWGKGIAWQHKTQGKLCTVQKSVIPMQQQYRLVMVDTWCYWVSMEWYWLIYKGTGSVEGGTGWYLVVLGQYGA